MTIPRDKQLHFAGGVLLSLLYIVLPLWWAFGIICTLAVGKEIRDALGFGTSEVLDALATIAGGVLGLAVLSLIVQGGIP